MESLVLKHQGLVGYMVKKYGFKFDEYEDMYSIGMLGLLKGAKTFKPELGYCETTYLSRCIYNELVMEIRKRNRHINCISMEVPTSEGLTIGDFVASPENNLEQLLSDLDSLLPELNEKERYCFVENVINGRNQEEIGKELGHSQAYVSRVIKRATSKLKRGVNHEL